MGKRKGYGNKGRMKGIGKRMEGIREVDKNGNKSG
jgi:hypothetical protein